jgi:hypothetical protein
MTALCRRRRRRGRAHRSCGDPMSRKDSPPTSTPSPIGVAVTSVKIVMALPLKPRSSRRNSLWNPLAGAAKRASSSRHRAEEAEANPAPLSVGVVQDDLLVGVFGETPGLGQAPPRPHDDENAERSEQIDRPPAPDTDRSARGRTHTAMPEPRPALMVSTDAAHARLRAGISSAAMIADRGCRARSRALGRKVGAAKARPDWGPVPRGR